MMVLKGMGIPYEAQDRLLPRPPAAIERTARKEIEALERLIAKSEEDSPVHLPHRTTSGGA